MRSAFFVLICVCFGGPCRVAAQPLENRIDCLSEGGRISAPKAGLPTAEQGCCSGLVPKRLENGEEACVVPQVKGACMADADCVVAGCSRQLCVRAGSDAVSTCEMRREYACFSYSHCGCIGGRCAWEETAAYTACRAKARSDNTGSGSAPNSLPVR